MYVASQHVQCGERLLGNLFTRPSRGPQDFTAASSHLAGPQKDGATRCGIERKVDSQDKGGSDVQSGLLGAGGSLVAALARQNKRCACLVNQDAIGFVDDCEIQTAQHQAR